MGNSTSRMSICNKILGSLLQLQIFSLIQLAHAPLNDDKVAHVLAQHMLEFWLSD